MKANEAKSEWIKFCPSLELPKERVSIAYDTHDERGVRYAYGYFQFYNGTCGCFWKDGNEQPKVVKAEDIKYWMPVPSLDVQEEPVSEEWVEELRAKLDSLSKEDFKKVFDKYDVDFNEEPVSEGLEKAAQIYNEDMSWCWEAPKYPHLEAFKAGAKWQLNQIRKENEKNRD